ncbi:MAG: hypothetical protein K9L30_16920 [Desulfobacterales bacterium]|nr:hypothetical protein [Desulfobacterales bacterium]
MEPASSQHISETALDTEEDEINLLDLFLVVLKHKILIIGIVFLTGLGALLYSLTMPNIYLSEATISPKEDDKNSANPLSSLGGGQIGIGGGGSLEKLELMLKSRELTRRVIHKHDLLPILYPDRWDDKAKKWREGQEPTIQDGWQLVNGSLLKIKADTGFSTLKVGIEHKDPDTAQKIVNYYMVELSEALREEVIHDASEKMKFFEEQLNYITDSMMRDKVYALLAKEIEKDTFARAQKYYSFNVVDPPIVPDLNKKIRPKRKLICILSVLVAFFMAIFISFLMEFVHRVKTDDPERYRKVMDGVKGWKISR